MTVEPRRGRALEEQFALRLTREQREYVREVAEAHSRDGARVSEADVVRALIEDARTRRALLSAGDEP